MRRTNKWFAAFLSLLLILTLLPAFPAHAEQVSGDWAFEVIGGKAEISYYSGAASSLSIPATLGG